MSKAVAKKEETALAVKDAISGDWSKFDGDTSDILIPKLLLSQAMSEVVTKEIMPVGTIYRSTTEQAMGGKGKPFRVIPLTQFKTWILEEKIGDKFEFRRVEPFTPANANLDWTFEENGAQWKRTKALNFYCLLPEDIDANVKAKKKFAETGELPEGDASLMPHILQFKSTSYKEGKTLATHFATMADFNAPPFVAVFQIDSEKVTNEKGTFYVLTCKRVAKTDDTHIPVCRAWHNIVKSSEMQIDHSDLEGKDTNAEAQAAAEDVVI